MWLGGINRGLQYVLRDDNYVRPLNTNFYQSQPLNLPPSWYNGGRGGIRIETPTAGDRRRTTRARDISPRARHCTSTCAS